MNKKVIALVLVVIPLKIFSQHSDSTKTNKFAIGMAFSPDFCYRTLDAVDSSKWIAHIRDSVETPKFGYTMGTKFSYRLSKRFSLGVGLLFSDKGYKAKQTFHWSTPVSSKDPTLPVKQVSNYHYYYLDIPLNLNYSVYSNDQTSFYVSASISTNIFLLQMTTSSTEYGDGHKKQSSTKTTGYNALNLAASVGVGYQMAVSDKLFLRIEPTYRRSITSIINAPIHGYLYSVGLDAGIFYRI